MESNSSLSHSQDPAIFHALSQINPVHSQSVPLRSIHTNYALIFQVVSYTQVSLPNPVYISPFLHTCYMPRPFHSSWFDHLDNTY
jgi:hypothetical protein